MSEKEKFESEFETEERELIVLVEESCMGACCLGDNYLRPSVRFIASADPVTGCVSKNRGLLCWLIKDDKDRKNFGFVFEEYQIYKIRVRRALPQETDGKNPIFDNKYMLLEILEEHVENKELEEMKEYLLTPIVINTEYGEFELNRQFSEFEGQMFWTECTVDVSLNTDEYNGETANKAMEIFMDIAKNKEEFDKKCKEYSAKQLLELAKEWNEEDEDEDDDEEVDITEEDFIEAITMETINISSDGSITVYYDDGDLFFGHVILVNIDENMQYESAHIAG